MRLKLCSECNGRMFIASCKTCSKEFKRRYNSKKNNGFCSPSCYSKYRIGKSVVVSFWETATEEQKFEHMKESYNRLVIKKDSDKCWDWNNKVSPNYYPHISLGRPFGKSKFIMAHRASWLIHYGEIPKDLWVLHRCDNKRCSNPQHLFLGTPKINHDDMAAKGRRNLTTGMHCTFSKLTIDDVHNIRKLFETKLSDRQIAEKFKVDRKTIALIRNRRTWKDII